MDIIRRDAARDIGITFYYSGKPCKKGHFSERYVSNNECRECRNEYIENTKESRSRRMAEYRELNKEKILQMKRNYYALVKNDPEFIAKRKLYQNKNKLAKKEYDIQYRDKNREAVNKRSREWVKKNPKIRSTIDKSYKARRRAHEKEGDSTRDIHRWEMKQNKVCYWCNDDCENSYHIDHYYPLAKGGTHTIENLVISCPSCNLKKNAKDPLEFAKQVGKLF